MDEKKELSQQIVDKFWDILRDNQWKWEFIRRSDVFKKDTARCLESGAADSAFIDIWDLPHPGPNAFDEYLYLPDFKTLLYGIANKWMLYDNKSEQNLKNDIKKFAKSFDDHEDFYYAGTHFLVHLREIGGKGPAGENDWLELTVMLPDPINKKWQNILDELKACGAPIFQSEYKSIKKGLHRLKVKTAWPTNRNEMQFKSDISETVRDIINEGLPDVVPWERKRKNTLDLQLIALDIKSKKLNRRKTLDKFMINDDDNRNHIRSANEKIFLLERGAKYRKSFQTVNKS